MCLSHVCSSSSDSLLPFHAALPAEVAVVQRHGDGVRSKWVVAARLKLQDAADSQCKFYWWGVGGRILLDGFRDLFQKPFASAVVLSRKMLWILNVTYGRVRVWVVEAPRCGGWHLKAQGKNRTTQHTALDSPSADWRMKWRRTQQLAAHSLSSPPCDLFWSAISVWTALILNHLWPLIFI